MKTRSLFFFAWCLIMALVLTCSAAAETYGASTMRLLRYEGDVEIFDTAGNSRFVMENARFASGEAMRTGAESLASVGKQTRITNH